MIQPAIVALGGPPNTRFVGISHPIRLDPRSLEAIETDLRTAHRQGARAVWLAGGEPLMRQDLHKILRSCLDRRLVPAILTNGRMLVYAKIRQLIDRAKVGALRIELHGPRDVHDRLVGVAGAFDQTVEGLRALLIDASRSLHIEVACTVLAENLPSLTQWVDEIATLPRRIPLTFRFVAPLILEDSAQWPRSEQVIEHLGDALRNAQRSGADLATAWEGFAPCLLSDHASSRDDSLRQHALVLGPREATAPFPLEDADCRTFPLPCQDCIHQPTCPGAPHNLLVFEGESGLRPTRSLRANSFNFELVQSIHPFHLQPGACTAQTIKARTTPARTVFLVDDSNASLYESPTSDFTDSEIAYVKDEVEQVYIDIEPGASLTDFIHGVKRTRFDPVCASCPDRPRCGGAMRIDPSPPFEREERWLSKEVSRLRGRVLDVGCGDSLYRDQLRTLIESGAIEYHALDPDDTALERLKAEVPGIFHRSEIENFHFEPGYFDYVLVLRSLNHFKDIAKSFEVISTVLRVQGQMVLCDSPPFAMLRTPRQVSYADEHAPVGHEHYRNWTSHQVVEFLKRYPFRVDVHRPVSVHTSNEWILKVMRMTNTGDCGPERS